MSFSLHKNIKYKIPGNLGARENGKVIVFPKESYNTQPVELELLMYHVVILEINIEFIILHGKENVPSELNIFERANKYSKWYIEPHYFNIWQKQKKLNCVNGLYKPAVLL